jgi:hypothetical protein
VGNGKPQAIRDPYILNLAFPIKNLDAYLKKTVAMSGDIEKMMEVYQSDIDFPELLSEKYLRETEKMTETLIKKA